MTAYIIYGSIYFLLYLIVAFAMYNEVLMRWQSYPECLDPDSEPPKWWWWILTFMPFNVIFIFGWIGVIIIMYFYDRKRRKHEMRESETDINKILNSRQKL